jgi:hypothetical protein
MKDIIPTTSENLHSQSDAGRMNDRMVGGGGKQLLRGVYNLIEVNSS